MELNTKYNGKIDYKDEDVICFPKGIPAFENLKKFIILPVEENDIFSILYSVEDTNVGIVMTSPFIVKKNYEFELDEEQMARLKIKNKDDVLVLSTVTLSSKIEKITTNLKAPIVINSKEKIGEQIILEKEEYKIKEPIFKGEV